MSKKNSDCEMLINQIKELRDFKQKEENVENRSYFYESEEFLIKSMKYTLNLQDMLKYLLRYCDSEMKFFDHIVIKSSKKFF